MIRQTVLAPMIALALMAATSAPARSMPDAAPVVAAERAFAVDGLAMGIDGSFLKWSTNDAVLIGGGGAQRAHEVLDPAAVFDPAAPSLVWWPNWAGIASSGDLGFTTGGVEVGGRRTGHYFTIWSRQPDGGWKWVYDGGSGASAADVPGPDTEPAILPVSTVTPISAEQAMAEVGETERALAAAARSDQKAAHLAAIADDARLYVAPQPPAIGRAAIEQALAGWPETFDFGAREGGGASQAGDIAWTYGPANWNRDGQARAGHYVRLWQRRPMSEGLWTWKLVFAQLIAPPTPPAAPAATPPPPPAGG